jgi:hypothetical protein
MNELIYPNLLIMLALMFFSTVILYLVFKLGEKHQYIKLFLMFIGMGSLVLLGGVVYDSNRCFVTVTNQTVVNNVTSFNYGAVCVTGTGNYNDQFYYLCMFVFTCVVTYLMISSLYSFFMWAGTKFTKRK